MKKYSKILGAFLAALICATAFSADQPACKTTGKNCPMNNGGACNCGKSCDCCLNHTVVRPDSDARVAPAAPAETHHVWSPTTPSTSTPRSCWYAFTAASVFGPKSPSTVPGSVVAVPYFFRPFCNAVTTLPEAPRDNTGVFGSAGSACQVIGPTTPSTVRPAPCWKSLTASSVVESKLPVILARVSTFVITKIR